MMFGNNGLSEATKGSLLMGTGLLLLLHTLGIIQVGLTYVIVAASLAMIVGGFVKAQGPAYVRQALAKIRFRRNG